MPLTVRSDYALRVMVALAAGGPAHLKNLAKDQGLSVPVLKQVVADLARSGLIATQRGRGGGITLARDPREIRMIDVKQAVDANSTPIGCPDRTRPCVLKDRCPVCAFWQRASAELAEIHRTTTIADFLTPNDPL